MPGLRCPSPAKPRESSGHRPFVWMLSLVLFMPPLSAEAARVHVELERTTVSVSESTKLTLLFDAPPTQSPPALRLPTSIEAEFLKSRRQQVSLKGRLRSYYAFDFKLTPRTAGRVTIPPQTYEVEGRQIRTQPVILMVRTDEPPSSSTKLARHAFLALDVPQEQVYVGEAFPIEVSIYLDLRIGAAELQEPHIQGDGFTFGDFPDRDSDERRSDAKVRIADQLFQKLSFRLRVTPVKTGKLTLGPAIAQAVLNFPRTGHLSLPFQSNRRRVSLKSDPYAVTVMPLPQSDIPEAFNGAIGQFSLSASAKPTEVTVGDPITLTLRLEGSGALDALSFPGQDWPHFKSYPVSVIDQSSDELGLTGAKTFEKIIVPQEETITQIPEVTFGYFDPIDESYKTVATDPIPIQVSASTQGKTVPRLADAPASDMPSDGAGLAPIRSNPGRPQAMTPPLVYQPWFWALQAIPLAAWLGGLIIRRKEAYLRRNPARWRQRQVRNAVDRGLIDLKRFAHQGDSPRFAAHLFRLLQEQLGERLDLPASAITEEILEERLRPEGADDDLVASLHDLFQLCNAELYSAHTHERDLTTLIPTLETTFERLRHFHPKPAPSHHPHEYRP